MLHDSYELLRHNQYMLTHSYDIYKAVDKKAYAAPLHAHDYYECMMYITGKIRYQVAAYTWPLEPFDILLILPDTMHRPIFSDFKIPYERIPLLLSRQWLEQYSASDNDLKSCFSPGYPLLRLNTNQKMHAYNLFSQLLGFSGDQQFGSDLLCQARILELLVFLKRCQSGVNMVGSDGNEKDSLR